jgi:hypothetical protein
MIDKIVLGPAAEVKFFSIDSMGLLIHGPSGSATGTKIVRLERQIPDNMLWQVLGRVGPGERYRLTIVEDSSLIKGENQSMQYVTGRGPMSDDEYLRRKMKGLVARAMFFSFIAGGAAAYAALYFSGVLK